MFPSLSAVIKKIKFPSHWRRLTDFSRFFAHGRASALFLLIPFNNIVLEYTDLIRLLRRVAQESLTRYQLSVNLAFRVAYRVYYILSNFALFYTRLTHPKILLIFSAMLLLPQPSKRLAETQFFTESNYNWKPANTRQVPAKLRWEMKSFIRKEEKEEKFSPGFIAFEFED